MRGHRWHALCQIEHDRSQGAIHIYSPDQCHSIYLWSHLKMFQLAHGLADIFWMSFGPGQLVPMYMRWPSVPAKLQAELPELHMIMS